MIKNKFLYSLLSLLVLNACVSQTANLTQSTPKPTSTPVTNNTNDTKPKNEPTINTPNNVVSTIVTTSPTPTPNNSNQNTNTTNTAVTVNTELPKITFSALGQNEANSGSSLTLKGNNFTSGKVKNLVFVNSSNTELQASISKMDNTEIIFSVPSNLLNGITNTVELSQSYQFVKIYLNLENGQKLLVSDLFKVLFSNSGSSSSSSSSSSGGGSSLGAPTTVTGSVSVVVNPTAPTTEIKGTVGILPKLIK